MGRNKIWMPFAILIVVSHAATPATLSKTIEEANNELRDAKPFGRYMHAAETADKEGNSAEAEKNFSAAMQEAEKLSAPEKPKKLTLSMLGLAGLYAKEGKNADAEAMYKRALATAEKPLPVDPQEAAVLSKLNLPVSNAGSNLMLTTVLFHYAEFLRKTNRTAEADKMDARGKALREKLMR